ncbi:MAG: CoA-binding protein, partial [Pseudomonadota bacterium]
MLGRAVYHRLDDIPENIDVLQVFRPSPEVPSVAQEALERRRKKGDIHVIWLQLGIKSEAAREMAESAGILFVQDKCMYVEHRRIFSRKEKA